MLELLAGPFAVTLDGTPRYFQNTPAWHDSLGLIGNIKVNPEFFGCIVQIDGTASIRAQLSTAGLLTNNLKSGGLAVATVDGGDTRFYEKADMRTLQESGDYLDTAAIGGDFLGWWTVLQDRYIQAFDGDIIAWMDGERVHEADLAHHLVAPANGYISPSREPGIVYVAFGGTGRIYSYNIATKTLHGRIRYIEPFFACFYSPKLGVFIGVHRDGDVDYVKIWANEVKPHSVLTPELVDEPGRGRVVRARTAVVGETIAHERCPGFVVHWSSSVGEVLDPYTTTDELGFVECRIRIPTDNVYESMLVTAECVVD